MRILVASEQANQRAHALDAVACEQHAAIGIDFARLDTEVRLQPPDVLVLLLATPDMDVIRRACGADKSKRMYVISVLAEHLPNRTHSLAIAAGSHDVLCAPYSVEELSARVDVHRRLRGWLDNSKTATARATGPQLELRTWDYLGVVVADDVEAMVGCPLQIRERRLQAASVQLATMAMSLPSQQLELCVTIAVDDTSRRRLGAILLGEPAAADELLKDMLRELANVAAGALKRAALPEGLVLGTGLPVDGHTLPANDTNARCWSFTVTDDCTIGLFGELRARSSRRVPARSLREGMVVAIDIRNDAGVVLLPSGTRLTSTTAHRLGSLLGAGLVEVSASVGG